MTTLFTSCSITASWHEPSIINMDSSRVPSPKPHSTDQVTIL